MRQRLKETGGGIGGASGSGLKSENGTMGGSSGEKSGEKKSGKNKKSKATQVADEPYKGMFENYINL